jgi:DNA-binding MarR family transcriptional regulator
MEREVKKTASEFDDLFLQFTEMLWEHVSYNHDSSGKTVCFSVSEHFLIEFLGKESFASMSKLSQLFHVAPTTMTSIVDRLVQRGYIKRRRAQQDRRKVLVTLSEKGKQFYSHHHQESLEVYARYLSKLPDKGKKLNQSLYEMKRYLNFLKEFTK